MTSFLTWKFWLFAALVVTAVVSFAQAANIPSKKPPQNFISQHNAFLDWYGSDDGLWSFMVKEDDVSSHLEEEDEGSEQVHPPAEVTTLDSSNGQAQKEAGSLATKPPPFHQPQPVPASSHHEPPVFPQRQGPPLEAPGAEADEPQQTTADDVKEYLLEQFKAVSEHLSDCEDYMALSEQLSSHIAEGMAQGTEAVAELMKKGTVKLKESIAPADEDVPVDPKIKAGLEAASWTADKAFKVSGFLVSKKAEVATLGMDKFLAPHVQRGSVKALSHFAEQSEEKSQEQMKMVSEVASGSAAAISKVFMALENSGKVLAKNIGENIVEVVKHRYGQEVGAATDQALSAAGSAYLAVHNIRA